MRLAFNQVKDLALVAMYETSYDRDDEDDFMPAAISEMLNKAFSNNVSRRALQSLQSENLVTSYSDQDGNLMGYSLTNEGWAAAEKMPSVPDLLEQFKLIPELDFDSDEDLSDELEDDVDSLGIIIPASDRNVSLGDNQIRSLTSATDDVVEELHNENSVDGDSSLRLRFLGQLRAANEIFRAESVRAYLVYELLVRMLGTLIEKYKDQAIAEAAKKLLGLLIEHVFKK